MFSRLLHPTNRAIHTRFRYGSTLEEFNLAEYSNSPPHYAKGTQSPIPFRKDFIILSALRRDKTQIRNQKKGIGLLPLVSTWFQVLFHSPNRGTFHLSLALLSSLSVTGEYLALGDGPPRFTPGSTCPALLGKTSGELTDFVYGTITLYGPHSSGFNYQQLL